MLDNQTKAADSAPANLPESVQEAVPEKTRNKDLIQAVVANLLVSGARPTYHNILLKLQQAKSDGRRPAANSIK